MSEHVPFSEVPSSGPKKRSPRLLERLALLAGLALAPKGVASEPPASHQHTASSEAVKASDEHHIQRLRQQMGLDGAAVTDSTDAESDDVGPVEGVEPLDAEEEARLLRELDQETPFSEPDRIAERAVSLFNPEETAAHNFADISDYIRIRIETIRDTSRLSAADQESYMSRATGTAYREIRVRVDELREAGRENDADLLLLAFEGWNPDRVPLERVETMPNGLTGEGATEQLITSSGSVIFTAPPEAPAVGGEEEAE